MNKHTRSDGFSSISDPTGILWTLLPPGIAQVVVLGISAGTFVGATYLKLLEESLEYNNGLSNCGTVTDYNSFTGVFTVWNQSNFDE